MYDLDELTAFAAVMASGSLTQSARELGLSKSTLSRRISQLEARLGQPLLRRQANRLLPTEAGRLFLGYSQQILRLAEQGRQALDDLSQEVSGELTVHVHSLFARSWLAQRVEEFLARFPGVRLELRTQLKPLGTPEDVAVCLWLGKAPECGLRQEELGHLSRSIYAHPDYLAHYGTPLHPRELAGHTWVDRLGDAGQALHLQHAHEGTYELTPPTSRLRVDQDILLADAITRGQGLGILTDWMVEQRLRAHPGTLVRCLEAWRPAPLPIMLLYPFGRLPRKVTSLLEHLRQAVPDTWHGDSQHRPLSALLPALD